MELRCCASSESFSIQELMVWGLIHYRDTSRWETRSQKHVSVCMLFKKKKNYYPVIIFTAFFFPSLSISYLRHANQLTMAINILEATCWDFRGVLMLVLHRIGVWLYHGNVTLVWLGCWADREIPAGSFCAVWITGPTGVHNLCTKLSFSLGHVLLSLTLLLKRSRS